MPAPVDGLSHPLHPVPRTALRTLNRAVMSVFFRREVEGAENLPTSGAYVMCPTHQSPWDATMVDTLTWRDVRYMAAEEQFAGARGWLMKWGGAFPVDRDTPGTLPLRHSIDVLEDGKVLCIFPEGKINKKGGVLPLKSGVGRIATAGDADSLVPIAITYRKDERDRPVERLAGYGAAAALTTAGLAAATIGGPVARTVAGAITGALSGGWLGGKLGAATTPDDAHPTFGKLLRSITFGAAGAMAGAAAGALFPLAGVPFSGFAVNALATHFRTRPVVHFAIQKPIEVAPYVQAHGRKAASDALVAALQDSLSAAKGGILNKCSPPEPSSATTASTASSPKAALAAST